jgi:hypothetical protein
MGSVQEQPTHTQPTPSPQPLLIAGLARMRHSSSSPVFDIGAPPSCPPSCLPTHPPNWRSYAPSAPLPAEPLCLCLCRALGCRPAAKLPAGPSSHRSRHPAAHAMLHLGVEHKQQQQLSGGAALNELLAQLPMSAQHPSAPACSGSTMLSRPGKSMAAIQFSLLTMQHATVVT